MKPLVLLRATAVASWMLAALAASPAWGSPGAHGPNGEHLDAPTDTAQLAGPTPRMEAQSEDFELVARLTGGEFTMMINRFATGEPVLGAQIEVESGPRKLSLPFQADMGDYATDDAALLKLLSTPGDHPLVITIVAGPDSDLLEGTLTVSAQAAEALAPGGHAHGHAHGHADGHDHGHGDDDHAHAPSDAHGHGWRHWLSKPITWILGFVGLAALGWGLAQWRRKGTSMDKPLGGV